MRLANTPGFTLSFVDEHGVDASFEREQCEFLGKQLVVELLRHTARNWPDLLHWVGFSWSGCTSLHSHWQYWVVCLHVWLMMFHAFLLHDSAKYLTPFSGFDLHLCSDKEVGCHVIYFWAIWEASVKLLQPLAYFPVSCLSLLLTCTRFWCILDTYPVLQALIVNMFYYSVDYLFIILMAL